MDAACFSLLSRRDFTVNHTRLGDTAAVAPHHPCRGIAIEEECTYVKQDREPREFRLCVMIRRTYFQWKTPSVWRDGITALFASCTYTSPLFHFIALRSGNLKNKTLGRVFKSFGRVLQITNSGQSSRANRIFAARRWVTIAFVSGYNSAALRVHFISILMDLKTFHHSTSLPANPSRWPRSPSLLHDYVPGLPRARYLPVRELDLPSEQ